jgi:hypothetical protein
MKRRSFLQSLFALAAGPVALPVQSKVPVVESVVRHGVGDYTINYKWVQFRGIDYRQGNKNE